MIYFEKLLVDFRLVLLAVVLPIQQNRVYLLYAEC